MSKTKKPDDLLDSQTKIPRAVLCEKYASVNIQGTLERESLIYLAEWMTLAAVWLDQKEKEKESK